MKISYYILISTLLVGFVSAEPPKKQRSSRYAKLWTNSLVTVKPKQEVLEENPLDDYALGGVTSVPEGYYVTLLHKKKIGEKIDIVPGLTVLENAGYKVIKVIESPNNYLSTSVTLEYRGKQGTVYYDEQILTARKSASRAGGRGRPNARNRSPQQGSRPQQARRPQQQQQQQQKRPPRVRRVPTPNRPPLPPLPR